MSEILYRFGLGWRYPARNHRFAMRDITAEIAEAHGLSVAVLLSKSSTRPVFRARAEAMSRCYEERHPDGRRVYSLPQIGAYFKRDHSSVLNAIRRHREANGIMLWAVAA